MKSKIWRHNNCAGPDRCRNPGNFPERTKSFAPESYPAARRNPQMRLIETLLTRTLATLNERRELCRQMLGDAMPEPEKLQGVLA